MLSTEKKLSLTVDCLTRNYRYHIWYVEGDPEGSLSRKSTTDIFTDFVLYKSVEMERGELFALFQIKGSIPVHNIRFIEKA